MSTWRAIGAFLVFVGIMWMISPLLRWAVMGELGAPLSIAILAAVGVAFFVAGVFVLRTEED